VARWQSIGFIHTFREYQRKWLQPTSGLDKRLIILWADSKIKMTSLNTAAVIWTRGARAEAQLVGIALWDWVARGHEALVANVGRKKDE
jgi:hypothetical protein